MKNKMDKRFIEIFSHLIENIINSPIKDKHPARVNLMNMLINMLKDGEINDVTFDYCVSIIDKN